MRNGSTIDFYEGLFTARTVPVDCVSDQLFACSTFTGNQNTAILARHKINLLPQILHRRRISHKRILSIQLAKRLGLFPIQPKQLVGILNSNEQLLFVRRLFEEIKSSFL